MKKDDGMLRGAIRSLLDEELPEDEAESLKDEGFIVKKPTRKVGLAIAIYKKAVSGDLSALKELRSILAGESDKGKSAGAVVIVDDIAD